MVRDDDIARVEGGLRVLPIKSFALGELRLLGERAEIDTEVTLADDSALHLHLTTVLMRSGEAWRVDYPGTVKEIATDSPLAALITRLQQLTARFGAGVNQSLEELKGAIPKLESELSNIEKELRSQAPELRRRLEDLIRELPPARPAPPPAADRRAI